MIRRGKYRVLRTGKPVTKAQEFQYWKLAEEALKVTARVLEKVEDPMPAVEANNGVSFDKALDFVRLVAKPDGRDHQITDVATARAWVKALAKAMREDRFSSLSDFMSWALVQSAYDGDQMESASKRSRRPFARLDDRAEAKRRYDAVVDMRNYPMRLKNMLDVMMKEVPAGSSREAYVAAAHAGVVSDAIGVAMKHFNDSVGRLQMRQGMFERCTGNFGDTVRCMVCDRSHCKTGEYCKPVCTRTRSMTRLRYQEPEGRQLVDKYRQGLLAALKPM